MVWSQNVVIKPLTHPQPAKGQLWALAWFTEIIFVKVSLCVPAYLCFSVCTHMSKMVNGESSLHVKNKSEMKPILNFGIGELVSFCSGLKYRCSDSPQTL